MLGNSAPQVLGEWFGTTEEEVIGQTQIGGRERRSLPFVWSVASQTNFSLIGKFISRCFPDTVCVLTHPLSKSALSIRPRDDGEARRRRRELGRRTRGQHTDLELCVVQGVLASSNRGIQLLSIGFHTKA